MACTLEEQERRQLLSNLERMLNNDYTFFFKRETGQLSVRAYDMLVKLFYAKIYFAELLKMTRGEALRFLRFKTILNDMEKFLTEYGLHFEMTQDEIDRFINEYKQP